MKTLDAVRQAEAFAEEAHEGQMRKGPSNAPYITHPLAVADILRIHGASAETIMAGMLHDVVEDTEVTLEDISHRFGAGVATIVDAVTEPEHDTRPWKQRKTDYIARIADAPYEAVLVSAADKVHNLRDTLRDYELYGDDIWSMFNSQKDTQFWYYRKLIEIFEKREIPALLTMEMTESLSRIHGRLSSKIARRLER